VAVGGDGTASTVRNHVPLEVPLLPLPLGTENLLARYLGQVSSPTAIRRTMDRGAVIGLDLGRANGRYFLLMVSAGFDADVIRRLHENRRGNITHAAYVKPVLQSIRSYKYPELRLYCGGNGSTAADATPCRWLLGFNLPLYACGLRSAPQASGTDALLDVCTFRRGSLPSTLRYLWHVALGRHLALADASLARFARFRVEAAGAADVAWQLDGDYGGTLPVEVDILPGALRLLVSRRTAVRLGFAVVGRARSTTLR
jgi:diacylglycerol kinase family enzyme